MVGGEYRKNESPGIIEDSEYEEEEEEEEDEEEEEVEEVNDDEVTQSEEGMGVADTEQGEVVQEEAVEMEIYRRLNVNFVKFTNLQSTIYNNLV